MLKYAIIQDDKTALIFEGTDIAWAISQGFTKQEVEKSDKDGNWYLKGFAPMKTDEEKATEEAERIAMLNLTAADVERAIYKAKGLDFDDIIALVERNNEVANLNENETTESASIDIKALKIELRANNFYRGNPYTTA